MQLKIIHTVAIVICTVTTLTTVGTVHKMIQLSSQNYTEWSRNDPVLLNPFMPASASSSWSCVNSLSKWLRISNNSCQTWISMQKKTVKSLPALAHSCYAERAWLVDDLKKRRPHLSRDYVCRNSVHKGTSSLHFIHCCSHRCSKQNKVKYCYYLQSDIETCLKCCKLLCIWKIQHIFKIQAKSEYRRLS
jgi:hypothetical protein